MLDPKPLVLLKCLSKEEIKAFDKFVQSPYFNTNSKMVELFHYLKPAYPEFNNGIFDKEKIFELLFPGQPYNDLRTRQYLSGLATLIEQFLSLQHIENDRTVLSHALMEEMTDRGSEKFFNQAYQSNGKNGETNHENGLYYFHQFRREDLRNQFLALTAQRQNRMIAQPDLMKTIQYLDAFYLINKLKYLCDLLNFKTIGALEQETILLDEILELLEKKDYSDVPAINIYHKILLTITEPDNEETFFQLLNLLQENSELFPQLEIREMYIYAQNFCIRQINKGKTEYLTELLNIYKIELEKEIILENGQLSPWDYKNTVVAALRSADFNWVESFINDYKEKLPASERENAYTYNLAKFHFYKKNYSEVLQLLQTVEYKDIFYSLDSKAMLLKTYYELDELESLYSLMDSFKVFLRRKKSISERHVRTYKNLIRITRKLSRSIPGDKKRAEALNQEIENTNPLADVGWLKEKVKELAG